MSEFVKLVIQDTWGSKYLVDADLVASGKALSACGTVDWADHALRPITNVLVRFPDGSEFTCPVGTRTVNGRVFDHGNEYSVSSDAYVACVKFHGLTIGVPLTDLEVSRDSLVPYRARKAKP